MVERGREKGSESERPKRALWWLVFSLVEAHYDTVFLRSNRRMLGGKCQPRSHTTNSVSQGNKNNGVFRQRMHFGGVQLVCVLRNCSGVVNQTQLMPL